MYLILSCLFPCLFPCLFSCVLSCAPLFSFMRFSCVFSCAYPARIPIISCAYPTPFRSPNQRLETQTPLRTYKQHQIKPELTDTTPTSQTTTKSYHTKRQKPLDNGKLRTHSNNDHITHNETKGNKESHGVPTQPLKRLSCNLYDIQNNALGESTNQSDLNIPNQTTNPNQYYKQAIHKPHPPPESTCNADKTLLIILFYTDTSKPSISSQNRRHPHGIPKHHHTATTHHNRHKPYSKFQTWEAKTSNVRRNLNTLQTMGNCVLVYHLLLPRLYTSEKTNLSNHRVFDHNVYF